MKTPEKSREPDEPTYAWHKTNEHIVGACWELCKQYFHRLMVKEIYIALFITYV
jgi:hypothetical protein